MLKFLNRLFNMVIMGVMRGLTVMTVNCQLSLRILRGGLYYIKIYIFIFIYIKDVPLPESCLMTVTVMTVDSPNTEISPSIQKSLFSRKISQKYYIPRRLKNF